MSEQTSTAIIEPCCISCDEGERAQYDDWRSLPRHFIVCPACGNKRCPKATLHSHPCTGSNEPNQPGSAYRSPLGNGSDSA